MGNNKKWYVFYCKSRADKKANEELQLLGYEAYLPLIQKDRVWSDRIKKVLMPMFPGYIFVYCWDYEIINVLQLNQIVTTVKIGSEFATIREKEIDLLRKIEKHGLKVTIEPLVFIKGDNVEIVAGALRGHKGVCIEDSNSNYLSIAIEGVNQSIKVKIGKEYLKNS